MTTTVLLPQSDPKILILGDLLIDETWLVNVTKISPEAPIPVASIISDKPIQTLGGAGLAAAYANKYNIPAIFMSEISSEAKNILDNNNISYISTSDVKKNIKKIRYIDNEFKYHLLRIDTDDTIVNTYNSGKHILNSFEICLKTNNIKCIAMLNYRKNIFREKNTCQEIIKLANKYNIPIFVDTRGNICKFSGCNVAKLNLKEYKNALEATESYSQRDLLKKASLESLLITKAAEGAEAHTNENSYYTEPKQLSGNPDVTGAGDVFDINFCYHYYYWTEQKSLEDSLIFATNRATEFIRQPVETRLC